MSKTEVKIPAKNHEIKSYKRAVKRVKVLILNEDDEIIVNCLFDRTNNALIFIRAYFKEFTFFCYAKIYHLDD